MRSKMGLSLVWGALVIAGLLGSSRQAPAANCALYARAETGVALYGAAGGWWDEAAGRYQRGHVPEVGAILVFKRSRHMPSGHVAVVARIVSAREILVDHANWYHGRVTRGMSVIDDSPDNDWSSVSVLDLASGKHGRDNPASGFVYPQTGPHDTGSISFASYTPSADDLRANSGFVHFAVLTEGRHAAARHRGAAHAKSARHQQRTHAARASSPHSGHATRTHAAHTGKSKPGGTKHHRA
ncbi:MAG TPA: CHAP domain-containing protein [Stellaceae bacterium]|jgi:surface antigen